MTFLKVVINLTLAGVGLWVAIKILSLVFDTATDKIISMPASGRKIMLGVLLALLLLIPLALGNSPYLMRTIVIIGIYIILALSLNLVVGFAGQLSMGHAAFYGIGAYTTALLTVSFGMSFWLALLISCLVAALFGLLLGIPTLRLKGDYLAITTIGFGEIVRLILVNWVGFTRGPAGIPGIPSPSLFGYSISSNGQWYYLLLVVVILVVIVSQNLLKSRLGRGLIAVRDNEIAAEAMGINPTILKITAFALGAAIAGIGGSMFAGYVHYVNPDNFTYMESVIILTMVVLGGSGSIPGVIVGAIVLAALPELLRDVQLYRYAIYGLMLIILMISRPQGMISTSGVKGGARSWRFWKPAR
ncbi:MAG: branched-chain amino acid ABC transporter permease [Methylocystaceae bacterium]